MKWEDHPGLTAGIGEGRIRRTGSFVTRMLDILSGLKNWIARKMMGKALFWIRMVMA